MTDWNRLMQETLDAGNIPAVLEIDRERGVLYVHDATNGTTALRICGLKKPIPPGHIDITLRTLIRSDVTDGYDISYEAT